MKIFESTMRTKRKATEVRPSVQGARRLKATAVAQGTKVTLQRLPQARKNARQPNEYRVLWVLGFRGTCVHTKTPQSLFTRASLRFGGTYLLQAHFKKIRGCGNNDICATWYNKAMHDTVKAKNWRDDNDPDGLRSITGLRVGGKRLTYDLDIYRNKNKVVKLFGKPIADLLAGERRVPYESLCTPYWRKNPKDDKEADQIARAFILCLIGSSFLNDKSQYGRSSSMGGYWRAWEVWACEYLEPFALSRPSGTLNTWPKFEVNWNPWGTNESDMPEAVINSVSATRKRILLDGPAGSAWYLGERVAMQSLGSTEPQEGEDRNLVGANSRVGNISPQLWSVRIPCWAAENGSKVVRIPRGQDSLDLPLPAGVTHVTAQAATEMLELISWVECRTFFNFIGSKHRDQSPTARDCESDKLKNTSGTTIGSSGIGEDVIDDDAEHEIRTKFKADHLGTKGKTKIVIPEEHEEDEEEEEEEEEEEDEEEDETMVGSNETDVGDEE
ncbi:hypothetical protein Prudu_010744 [Prunus dulcis]|uniref:Uncharacterized protein n=1 Tax=Prunus dulcis TaxID=3755 RepID=A0A4Y1R921_PRUDU|nr:hypothetical protein Prudu_010744 [Prunus dulcis]